MNRERFMPHPVTGWGISVQSDNRARSSSTLSISSLRRGFLASDVSAHPPRFTPSLPVARQPVDRHQPLAEASDRGNSVLTQNTDERPAQIFV